MTQEAINRACAELCGWKFQQGETPCYGGAYKRTGWFDSHGFFIEGTHSYPPFTTSLDAAQMAFRALTASQKEMAEFYLWNMSMRSRKSKYYMETEPLQWCEAVLRAAGKWEE